MKFKAIKLHLLMAEESHERELQQTPTWAVAGVCAVIVLISFILEKGLSRIGMWLTRKQKRALLEALDKVKEELMVMGFISLLLTFSQGYIAKICIPSKVADHMLPCALDKPTLEKEEANQESPHLNKHRLLMIGDSDGSCHKGSVPLITVEAAHQLHVLIFFLATFHVFYSAATMMLGRLKIRGWKEWEHETSSPDYELSNNPSRFRLTHETSFVKAHNGCWARTPFFFYVGCFFRQFFRSVTRADYLTLRNGFITAHIAPGGQFNFQKYIKKSLEDDFKVVVGVSPVLWASFVLFLLLNVQGWHTLFWASILPLITILAVGTKLQCILTRMALEITERHSVVQGIPLVKGSDEYFWFSRPQLILHLLHFTLFQNAFQITYFLWILYEFGLNSCFHDRKIFVLIKISIGIGAMILCSYSTLPLYALVTQLGGPTWRVQLGRRDSTTASLSTANTDIPSPTLDLSGLLSAFSKKGLTAKELVALSGAHTIGRARCVVIRNRIYNETNIDASFAKSVQSNCPSTGGDNNLTTLDVTTPDEFDNGYFKALVNNKGVIHSDQQLFNGGSTDSQVTSYSKRPSSFYWDFAKAMIKMGNLSPLTGSDGEIRTSCWKTN